MLFSLQILKYLKIKFAIDITAIVDNNSEIASKHIELILKNRTVSKNKTEQV
ncbi:MAG: hypothetical protein LBS29_02370 [Endomicrobium sp.]|jgi:hypothetical protein|nr:hypothetical protein [Endomicrobium sp.]